MPGAPIDRFKRTVRSAPRTCSTKDRFKWAEPIEAYRFARKVSHVPFRRIALLIREKAGARDSPSFSPPFSVSLLFAFFHRVSCL
jgi:hypothetical protein